MTTECQYCRKARNLPPGATLCVTPCLERLEAALIDIPDLSDQLLTTLARQDRVTAPGQAGGGGLKAASREPSNGAAREPAELLTDTLRAWAATLDQDHGNTATVGYSRRIHAHLDKIRSRPDAGDLTDEILHAYHQAQRVVDLPPEKVTLGTCGTEHENIPCPGQVKGIKKHHEARCDTCGETYSQQDRLNTAAANAWEHPMPLATVIGALRDGGMKINLKSAQRWASEGHLRTPWADHHGTAIYTVAQVIEVARERRKKRGRPKSQAA